MSTVISPTKEVLPLSRIRRISGRPGDRYEVIFLDQQDRIVVALTEWYRIRSIQGPVSTCNTYLSCLLPYFTFRVRHASFASRERQGGDGSGALDRAGVGASSSDRLGSP